MTNSSVGFPQFYQIQQILDRFLGNGRGKTPRLVTSRQGTPKSSQTR
ncbi:hypothetical protein GKD55_12230 [Lactobacillus paracasei]|nr:hypothetical protein [Lacticaseibacillus paracasei]MSC44193.1 hypothetical protein [Lacticaseibacillus paracasei]